MVNISLQGVIDDFKLTPDTAMVLCRGVLQAVTATVLDQVRLVSGRSLNSTRMRYHQAIQVAEKGPLTNGIYLADPVANMMEDGATAFDMKVGLLKGPNVKYATSGKNKGKPYLTVPMRHGTPGALGENAAFSGNMPVAVYNAAKMLAAYRTMPGGQREQGTPLTAVPKPFDKPATRQAITKNVGALSPQQLAAYHHKSSIYSGMQRQEKTYEKATQNSYVSFRRVSLASAQNAWIHPGITAGRFMEAGLAQTNIEYAAGVATENLLAQLGML